MITLLPQLWQNNPPAFWILTATLAYFLWMGWTLSWIDARTHLLPNRIVLPSYATAIPLCLIAFTTNGPTAVLQVLAAGAAYWALLFAVRFVNLSALGFGDVKLAGVLGMYLGLLSWGHVFIGALTGFALAAVVSSVALASRKMTRQERIPLGPYLVVGAAVAMILPATGA